MGDLYKKLMINLQEEDAEKALKLCISALEDGDISIVELYEDILAKALNSIIDEWDTDVESLIWKEHVRSGIIRMIIESSYPYVLKERDKLGLENLGNVIVMCPEFEDHELGARMVTDFFIMAGYKTTFIGANTPPSTTIKAVEIIKPKYICMSVTNYYNLIGTKKTIQNIKTKTENNIIFLLGGNAFSLDPKMCEKVGGDMLLKTFKDILSLSKDVR